VSQYLCPFCLEVAIRNIGNTNSFGKRKTKVVVNDGMYGTDIHVDVGMINTYVGGEAVGVFIQLASLRN
jgi:hypothetical protein